MTTSQATSTHGHADIIASGENACGIVNATARKPDDGLPVLVSIPSPQVDREIWVPVWEWHHDGTAEHRPASGLCYSPESARWHLEAGFTVRAAYTHRYPDRP